MMALTNTVTLSFVRIWKKHSNDSLIFILCLLPYLLRRNIVCRSPHVNLLIHVEARDDEEHTRAPRSTLDESAEAEDDGSLVLLHHLHHPEEAQGERHQDQDEGEEGEHVGEQAGTLLARHLVTW